MSAVLGPGLNEEILGCPREIAQRWAETYHFPMAPHQRDDLPQVAQFLAINQQAKTFPTLALERLLRRELANRFYDGTLPGELQKSSFTQVLSAVGERLQAKSPSEPHKVLASLPFRIYITATPDNLLTDALRLAHKDPQVAICPWKETLVNLPSVFSEQPDYEPTEDKPLVYHLFGRFKETSKDPDSLVLTEDDYFDYLIGVTKNIDLVPKEIQRVMADSALLFLGFHIDDWDFRVLFRSLMSLEGSTRLGQYANVAVQIDPEVGRLMNPKLARRYLEKYFDNAKISIFWGRPEGFHRCTPEELYWRCSMTPNPYVGPRAFGKDDTLYGRDQEVKALLNLLIARRIVLLYSPSGAGKTSLIQAGEGLMEKLVKEEFRVLPVMRPGLATPPDAPSGANRYLLSVLMSLNRGFASREINPFG